LAKTYACRWQKPHPVRKRWDSETFPRILCLMVRWLALVLHLAVAAWKSRRYLLLENLTLRHQLRVLSRCSNRPRLRPLDRALWVWFSHSWKGWKTSFRIFQPDTVIQWHRAGSVSRGCRTPSHFLRAWETEESRGLELQPGLQPPWDEAARCSPGHASLTVRVQVPIALPFRA